LEAELTKDQNNSEKPYENLLVSPQSERSYNESNATAPQYPGQTVIKQTLPDVKTSSEQDSFITDALKLVQDITRNCYEEMLDAYGFWQHDIKDNNTLSKILKEHKKLDKQRKNAPEADKETEFEQAKALYKRFEDLIAVKINEKFRKKIGHVIAFLRMNLVDDSEIVDLLSNKNTKVLASRLEGFKKTISSYDSIDPENNEAQRQRSEQIKRAYSSFVKEWNLFVDFLNSSKGDSAKTPQRKAIIKKAMEMQYLNPILYKRVHKNDGRLEDTGSALKSKGNVDLFEQLEKNINRGNIKQVKESVLQVMEFINKYQFHSPEFYTGSNKFKHGSAHDNLKSRKYDKTRDESNYLLARFRKEQGDNILGFDVEKYIIHLKEFVNYINDHLLSNYLPFVQVVSDRVTGNYKLEVVNVSKKSIIKSVKNFDTKLTDIADFIVYILVGENSVSIDSENKIVFHNVYHVADEKFDEAEHKRYKIAFRIFNNSK